MQLIKDKSYRVTSARAREPFRVIYDHAEISEGEIRLVFLFPDQDPMVIVLSIDQVTLDHRLIEIEPVEDIP